MRFVHNGHVTDDRTPADSGRDRTTPDALAALLPRLDGEDEHRAGRSPYDRIRTPAERRSLRQLAPLMRDALQIVWRAGRGVFVASAVVQVASGVAVAAQLLVARALIDGVVVSVGGDAGLGTVLMPLSVLVAVTALIGLAAAVQSETSSLLAELVTRQATRDILDVATSVDLEAYEVPAFHDRLERARLNAQTRPVMAVNGLLGAFNAAVGTLGIAVALAAIEPVLVPAALLSLAPLYVAATRNSREHYRFSVGLTAADRERTYVQNVLANKDMAKEVRAFDLSGFFRDRFEALFEQRIVAVRAHVRRRLTRAIVATLASSVVTALTVALVVWLLFSGRTDLAGAGTAVIGIVYLGQRLSALVAAIGRLYESALFIEDFMLFLETGSARPPDDDDAALEFNRILIDGVSFTYPGAHSPALRDVTMRIGHGEVVALVGDNGSGKTTLAKIVAGLYGSYTGRVLWDDIEAGADVARVRRSVAVIFQDFGRYWLSARDNIGIGATQRRHDREAIVRAATIAGAHSFLSSLPSGYDTVLSRLFEGGRDLSIGQWQRVALGRAFFREAPLVIMDEPTAAIDALAEAELFGTIRDALRGRAVLLISHRFSSVRTADHIYVLHEGQVVEHGTHAELMHLGGRYARMFSVQAAAYLEPE